MIPHFFAFGYFFFKKKEKKVCILNLNCKNVGKLETFLSCDSAFNPEPYHVTIKFFSTLLKLSKLEKISLIKTTISRLIRCRSKAVARLIRFLM